MAMVMAINSVLRTDMSAEKGSSSCLIFDAELKISEYNIDKSIA
jgi:hypothetical protein